MAILIDGKAESVKIQEALIKRAATLSVTPRLVIIQIGSADDANIYIQRKKKYGEGLGVIVDHVQYDVSTDEDTIVEGISSYNSDPTVHGIIVQLPVPKKFNTIRCVNTISPGKDVDGLTRVNRAMLLEGDAEATIPATTKGILKLLGSVGVTLEGKRVVLVGRSSLVGKPTAIACLNRNATVTMCHSYTKNLLEETRRADVVIVATGSPRLITEKHVTSGQVIIDVGINRIETESGKKIVGDVDTEAVGKIVDMLTPVPGGVGPMTVACLFENLIETAEKNSIV
ncbi:MAG: bifunctional 5,10-methylenetetrahydrofolate dehydrogenase/5,10-methenyltetrahydrofolate cyclohydrolase [Candidatus Paceibacterota bacterium]|jgi:methylenetetrahydrofolate dehydrogenase (NADP+)/methenyltetrahydrofolate cyclohydrolase